MAPAGVPKLDEELRVRLGRRFRSAIDAWVDALPAVLADLADRWDIEWGSLIRRGSMSVVIRCRARGRPAVLKVSLERERIAHEAAALARWRTTHVPVVLAVDESVGALLIEAIEPGTPLLEAEAATTLESLAALLTSLHEHSVPDPVYPSIADHRVAYLFDAGEKNYVRRPDLADVVPRELYARGRRLALRLAGDVAPSVLLHGDLTPANVLDGGVERGLVAIDPAPCLGDPAFDAIDLVFWRAEEVETIAVRAEQLAGAIGASFIRLLDWCTAFAGMVALETAEGADGALAEIEPLLALASHAS
jgi:streptomycin 6-kinase